MGPNDGERKAKITIKTVIHVIIIHGIQVLLPVRLHHTVIKHPVGKKKKIILCE